MTSAEKLLAEINTALTLPAVATVTDGVRRANLLRSRAIAVREATAHATRAGAFNEAAVMLRDAVEATPPTWPVPTPTEAVGQALTNRRPQVDDDVVASIQAIRRRTL
ncbi:hypothetical protein [Nocardiopsis synnemataformans]|uniref:hypothetical protein n=1 Tax=Nocardiopsis synnemataformans TaxID=61305 RepID=UPI003EC0AD17